MTETLTLNAEDGLSQELIDAIEPTDDDAAAISCFITNDEEVISPEKFLSIVAKMTAEYGYEASKAEPSGSISAKSFSGSSQSEEDLRQSTSLGTVEDFRIVEPPYPPDLMAEFLEVDETHFRCVSTKASDTVNRGYSLDSILPVFDPVDVEDESKKIPEDEFISKDAFKKELKLVKNFISECNPTLGFEGTLKKGCLDYEGIGWAAFEVVRSADKKIRRLIHIPASRVRVIKGWKGFVEIVELEGNHVSQKSRVVYYQTFGEKVISRSRKSDITGKFAEYDPEVDGEISSAEWNLVDKTTGKPTSSFKNSANEILWIPKIHNNTVYYGYTDVVPAIGNLMSKINIRDFVLQFFEHNTIPRYAVIIEGGKATTDVQEKIEKYFSVHIKGRAHKTLVIGVPHKGGKEVKIRFEKLQVDEQEASFQETRKNDSQAIMVAHGVSPAIIGVQEAASLGSGKGLSQAEIYKDRIVTPNQNLWGGALTRVFRIGLGTKYIKLMFDPLDIRDREAEQRTLDGYLGKAALTINQVRKRAGLGDPLPGGDRAFILTPQGIVFLDTLFDMETDDKAIRKLNQNQEEKNKNPFEEKEEEEETKEEKEEKD